MFKLARRVNYQARYSIMRHSDSQTTNTKSALVWPLYGHTLHVRMSLNIKDISLGMEITMSFGSPRSHSLILRSFLAH